MKSWPAKKQNIISAWKCRSRSPFTKTSLSQLLFERFLPNFHKNDDNVAGNKNLASADLVNAGSGCFGRFTSTRTALRPSPCPWSCSCFFTVSTMHRYALDYGAFSWIFITIMRLPRYKFCEENITEKQRSVYQAHIVMVTIGIRFENQNQYFFKVLAVLAFSKNYFLTRETR